MGTRNDRTAAYIAKSAEFARPILEHLREAVHGACPDLEEAYKWSFPCFMYKGMLCNMAAFKEHCAFGFWKRELVLENGRASDEKAMGQFGRITRLSDLPPDDILIGYIHKAMKLNDDGVKNPSRQKPKTPSNWSSPTTWSPRWRPTPRLGPRSSLSVPVRSENMSSGSQKPRPRPPARSAWPPRSNGWLRGSNGTGNTRIVDGSAHWPCLSQ